MTNLNTILTKAGGIITKKINGNTNILLLFRKKQEDWTFPKGHQEAGESAKDTAIREIFEETGLTVEIIDNLPEMNYKNNAGQEIVNYMFLMMDTENTPLKIEKDGDKLEWINLDNVLDKIKYPNLLEYFNMIKSRLI